MLHSTTSYSKLSISDHRVYFKTIGSKCIGFVRCGNKSIHVRNEKGQMVEIEALCIFDFYVHENWQRKGQGRMLLDHVLTREGTTSKKLAVDRINSALMHFFHKNYGLFETVATNTGNISIFLDFFRVNQQNVLILLGWKPRARGFCKLSFFSSRKSEGEYFTKRIRF